MKYPLILAAFGIVTAGTAGAETAMTVFKDPNCGCCAAWADEMSKAGFEVTIRNLDYDALVTRKAEAGIPEEAYACHTAMIGDFAIEGHVPAAEIEAVMAERPEADGIAVPGMPMGSPGMGELTGDMSFDVMLIENGEIGPVVASYPPR